ncbi:HPP family protein [Lacimicrobium alkaliphilum]|uniref:Phage tail protein n=1 Tax=Lacimicrobium alkaliphilum TaxID=1526571 RepID=A0A0U2ZG76_9ALTE|nr:HPP family protein [Lacimicrobium alkaliphilum]ALS98023.1 phage tail protein [Lacimicrobium alkaliphilum]
MKGLFWQIFDSFLNRSGITKADSQKLSSIPIRERFKVAAAAFLALLVVTYTSHLWLAPTPGTVMLASMGASAVLLFGLPNSPLARPWSFAAGHLIAGMIGLMCSQLFTDMALMAAVTIALVLLAMYFFECMHPPGGATALVPVIASHESLLDYQFLFTPLMLNVFTMLLMAMLLNRLILGHNYLPRLRKKYDPVHLHHDPSPLKRLGLQPEDILHALNHYSTIVDISEQDLERLYQEAQMHAVQRKLGDIRCKDIMSADLITVSPDTSLQEAWQRLKTHKIRMLPVTDSTQQLLGVITVADFLKALGLTDLWSATGQFSALASARAFKLQNKQVANLMVTEVRAVSADEPLISLIPMLSDQGLHHVPVLDNQQKLVGIVTQSDLIAALYAQHHDALLQGSDSD